jgi:cytochrome c oxidase assembly factor CtaG
MRSLKALCPGLGAWLVCGVAHAHGLGAAPGPAPGWSWDPSVTLPLGLSALVFGAGWLRLRRRSRHGGERLEHRAALFAAGWLTLVAALVSPLHQAGERAFSAHMVEHELLMLLAAPLLVLSRPLSAMIWAFPAAARQGLGAAGRWAPLSALWRRLTEPVTTTLAQAAALWLWHAPFLFSLALASTAWHIAQHLCFLVTALLFWSAMLRPTRAHPGLAVLCLFATSVVSGALGALMAFSESPWYPAYAAMGMAPFGLTPAEDQQVAGLLMWIPGGLVHAGAALALVGRALKVQRSVEVQPRRPAHAIQP